MSFHSRFFMVASAACFFVGAAMAFAVEPLPRSETAAVGSETSAVQSPAGMVRVQPEARDREIGERLERILTTTKWYADLRVEVQQGVVFYHGTAATDQAKKWAGDLARNTEDVVAVVNRLEVATPAFWDLSPAIAGLKDLGRKVIGALPLIAFGAITLFAAYWVARLVIRLMRAVLRRHVEPPLLRQVIARAIGVLVFLTGLYIVLQVSGLTRLAMTVIGGTGLIGLVLGIAFRDISENFLASIFLTMQRPFRPGDLVEVAGCLGYIERLTIRTTVLMTLDGNHVQIPNATIYKSILRNFSSNPNRREDFVFTVSGEQPLPIVQEVALDVLSWHPAVLKSPEPWVLVDSLGKGTANIRVYFWLDGTKHSWLKVRSSVIRLVKRAIQDHGIALPDDGLAVTFPRGAEIEIARRSTDGRQPPSSITQEKDVVTTEAESGLSSEAEQIRQQASRSRPREEGRDLLTPSPDRNALS